MERVTIRPGATAELNLTACAAGTIAMSVTNLPAGRPHPAAKIRVRQNGGAGWDHVVFWDANRPGSMTDWKRKGIKRGIATLKSGVPIRATMPPGSYQISIEPNEGGRVVTEVHVTAGMETPVTIDLTELRSR